MIRAFLKKYLSIVFVLATFMGVLHHHHDLKPHNDCQICTIQSNLESADTPTETLYISEIDLYSESILTPLCAFIDTQTYSTLNARAPPKIS